MQRTPPPAAISTPKIIIKESVLNKNNMTEETENMTLSSDDDTAVEKIDNLSNALDFEKKSDKDNDVLSIVKQIRATQCTKDDLVEVHKTINEKFGSVKKELNVHKSRINTVEERLLAVETELSNSVFNNELSKQQQLKDNLTIFGIPMEKSENVFKLAISVFKAIGCDFTSTDFKSVHRTKARSEKMSSIIVKFCDFDNKLKVLNAKNSKTVTLKDIIPKHAQAKNIVFVNNHVTPFFAKLMALGRQAVKNKTIHSCWIGSAGCMIKKNENSSAISIRSIDAMEKEIGPINTKRSNRELSASPANRIDNKKQKNKRGKNSK